MRNLFAPRRLCALSALALLFSIPTFSQSDVGSIVGFVRDQTGAVIPGVSVIIKSDATGEEHPVTSDSSGHYTVTNLLPGLYTLTAEVKGFKKFTSTHNKLDANSTLSLDANLQVGQTTETIEVSDTGSVLQTESAAVQSNVNAQQIEAQELNGRNPLYMAQLLPGIRRQGTLGDFNFSLDNGGFAINGARSQDTVITMDGAPAVRTRANGTSIGVANVDATQEIQVLTADYAPEYGRAAGGQIRVVSKSGSTDFHGAAFEYFRNNDLNANTWSRNLSKLTNSAQAFHYNDFGFAVGGPLAVPGKWDKFRQKFFWFVAQEWTRYHYSETAIQTVPTALMRQGNFSELLSPNPWYKGSTILYDPSTCPSVGAASCKAFPGNIIPASRLSHNGLAILDAYPAPTPGFLQGTQNWIAQAAHPINQRKGNYNGDIIPTDKHHIELRRTDFSYDEYQPFDQNLGITPKYFHRPNQANTVAWTWTINPTTINEARVTLSIDDVYIPVNTTATGFNRQDFGINYNYLIPVGKDIANKIPTANVPNFTSLSGGPYPSHSSGPIFTLSDSLTKVIGNHTLKFGFYWEYSGENDEDQINVNTVPGGSSNQNGTFQFSDGRTGLGATSGVGLANLALGLADSYTEIGPRAYTIWRGSMYEAFAQDSWKVTPKFTLTYGVRESTIVPFYPLWGNSDYFNGKLYNPSQAVTVDPKTGNVILADGGNPYNGVVIPGFSSFPSSAIGRVLAASSNQCDGASCNGLFAPNISKWYVHVTNQFQPRLGIAWQLDPKTVIRAGGGRFLTRMGLLDNIFPGGNSPFQPFVTVNNVSVDNPGASLTTGVAAPLTMTTLNPNLKPPEAWNWNVTFQREMFWKSVLSVGYVAHRGLHGWDVYDINQPAAGALTANPNISPNYLRPYKGFASIQEEESVVNSMYNSLQITWSRQFTSGSTFSFAYTLSKSKDNSSNYRDIVPDTYNTSNLWGPSEFDSRHAVVISYSYNLPFFQGQKGLTAHLLGGWQITGTAQFQTGVPCSVGVNNDYAGVGEVGSFGCGSGNSNGGTNTTSQQLWNVTSSSTPGGFAGPSGSTPYFTAVTSAPAAGTFALQKGIRDIIYGPGFQNWNLGLFKKFLINERTGFEFRAEAYNFINHPNWNLPNYNATAGTFGEVTSKSGSNPRNLQLSLRYYF